MFLLSQMEVPQLLRKSLGLSVLRLQPKRKGVRLIGNLSTKKALCDNHQSSQLSVNDKLKQPLRVLQFEV